MIRHQATTIGVPIPSIHFRAMRTKRASMSTRGRMTVDTGLLRVPRELGEFVIVHELVHLLSPNHGRVFKSFMHAYMPDWEVKESRLRSYAARTFKKLSDTPN